MHEFHGIVTHTRIYTPPSTSAQAIAQIESWLESPTVQLLNENETYWLELREMLMKAKVQGPLVHDARIAALCLSHGVHELLDRIRTKYEETISPYYAASRLWLDAMIDPLETRTWVSMGIDAASQSPATREFNMGVLQT